MEGQRVSSEAVKLGATLPPSSAPSPHSVLYCSAVLPNSVLYCSELPNAEHSKLCTALSTLQCTTL